MPRSNTKNNLDGFEFYHHPHITCYILAKNNEEISNYDSENGTCWDYEFLEMVFEAPIKLGQVVKIRYTAGGFEIPKFKVISYKLVDKEEIGGVRQWYWEVILVREESGVGKVFPSTPTPTKTKIVVY